jgi:hypothetical protein
LRREARIPPRDLRLRCWLIAVAAVLGIVICAIVARSSSSHTSTVVLCPSGMLARELVGGFRVCQPPSHHQW